MRVSSLNEVGQDIADIAQLAQRVDEKGPSVADLHLGRPGVGLGALREEPRRHLARVQFGGPGVETGSARGWELPLSSA